MANKWIPAAVVAVVVVGGAALYLNSDSQKAKKDTSSAASSPVSGKVLALGSTALQPLADEAGKDFASKNAGVTVTVQGGGSGAGLKGALDGSAQIGNSDVYAAEKLNKVDADKLVDHEVAVVGIAPVTNKDAGVKNLTTAQIKDIFTGKVTNWKEVGGKDEKIVVVNREDGSGTRFVFEKETLGGAKAIDSQTQTSTGAVITTVSSTPGAIGYVGFSGLKDSVQAVSVDGVAPENKNVEDNSYKIWAYEHMYTKGEATGAAKAYIDYLTSDDVQKTVVPKLGFISIADMKVSKDIDGKITNK